MGVGADLPWEIIMKRFVVAVLGAAFAVAPATAAINLPIPSNAYITANGLDWAWGAPLPDSFFSNALSYQGTQGWRLPTLSELAFAPLGTDFIFSGANVPFGGYDAASGSTFQATNSALTGAAACAAGYFNTGYAHCDWQDGRGPSSSGWAGTAGASSYADQLYVRDASPAVPEPATWAMMVGGLGIVGAIMRRRVTTVSFA